MPEVHGVRRLLAPILLALVLAGCQLDYDRLGIHGWVVDGGQSQIDQGKIVHVTWMPGFWVGAHRTDSGGPFGNLPNAQVGDTLTYGATTYRVVNLITVEANSWQGYHGSLVLQTSLPNHKALLVICEPV